MAKSWIIRIGAALGCVALFLGTMALSSLLLRRSWRDLEDTNTRMHIFRFHVYDMDFIWSAIAFGANALIVVTMFLFCFWMFWILIHRWESLATRERR